MPPSPEAMPTMMVTIPSIGQGDSRIASANFHPSKNRVRAPDWPNRGVLECVEFPQLLRIPKKPRLLWKRKCPFPPSRWESVQILTPAPSRQCRHSDIGTIKIGCIDVVQTTRAMFESCRNRWEQLMRQDCARLWFSLEAIESRRVGAEKSDHSECQTVSGRDLTTVNDYDILSKLSCVWLHQIQHAESASRCLVTVMASADAIVIVFEPAGRL